MRHRQVIGHPHIYREHEIVTAASPLIDRSSEPMLMNETELVGERFQRVDADVMTADRRQQRLTRGEPRGGLFSASQLRRPRSWI
ncbi:hypothetical protein ABZV58_31145 [Nocardia sp. NPDC004654]|uniref:hypothetical protein n=1 Tax=Nocardia sp. NPDC004654 TaxID=3154776 RepID=UPI0033BC3C27